MNNVSILIVEDNEADIMLTREALLEGKLLKNIEVVRDGEEAIQYLDKTGKFINVQTPDLILLDINLPRINGFQILNYVKESDHLKNILVIMLSTSSSIKDKEKAFQGKADLFITKPFELEEYVMVISIIEDYWMSAQKN